MKEREPIVMILVCNAWECTEIENVTHRRTYLLLHWGVQRYCWNDTKQQVSIDNEYINCTDSIADRNHLL